MRGAKEMDSLVAPSAVRGYHVYKAIWTPEIGEKLTTRRDRLNEHDRFVIAVMKGKLTVGHVSREISKLCCLFMKKGGSLTCTVTGPRRRSPIEAGGLEIPCSLNFEGPPELLAK